MFAYMFVLYVDGSLFIGWTENRMKIGLVRRMVVL